MTVRKFYLNTFTIQVLSEDAPLAEVDLEGLHYLVTEGPCVLKTFSENPSELTPADMATALIAAGSDPGFFNLNDDGTDAETW